MLIEAEDKILKEFLEYKRKQEEKKAVKRPAHRPAVRLFVDDNGKELMLSCLKSVIEKYYAPLTGRIVIAGVGISKTRFWILAYVAFAAMGIIKPGNNVDTYQDHTEQHRQAVSGSWKQRQQKDTCNH